MGQPARLARSGAALVLAVAAVVSGAGARAEPGEPIRIDGALSLAGWSVSASPGSWAALTCEASEQGTAVRVDYHMARVGGFVILRREIELPLPENFAFRLRLRGEAPRATLEVKVEDDQGNVWWRRYPDFAFARTGEEIIVRRSRLVHAWGPRPDAGLRRTRAVEVALNGGAGGMGTFWIDELLLEPREPSRSDGTTTRVTASSARPGFEPERLLDDSAATGWKSVAGAGPQWLEIDFGRPREYGGLTIDWDPLDYATAYAVAVSVDGAEWKTVYRTESGRGGRAWVYTPDAESRYLRLVLEETSRGRGVGVAAIALQPIEISDSPNAFFAAIARNAPRGWYPRYLLGEQTYWTVVGLDHDTEEALLNDDGMVEIGRAFSIEPFLYTRGDLVTWHDVERRHELAGGDLPIPTVEWRWRDLALRITAFAAGRPGAATLYLRYRMENRDRRRQHPRLFLAVRPFQVLPPWQTLNIQGGVARIHEIRFDGHTMWVNRRHGVVALVPPLSAGAATFEDGGPAEFLVLGETPEAQEVRDATGFASGAFAWDFALAPGATSEVALAIPLDGQGWEALPAVAVDEVPAVQERMERRWQRTLRRVDWRLPPEAAELGRTARTVVGHMLINRDGPAFQPGSRTYARSWIRDGAMTAEALLQMGLAREVRRFLRWYARQQGEDGRIPCCVDTRGPDWTPEHDSEGAFIYALAEYWRFTGDLALVRELWPTVVRAVEHLARLRAQRLTPAWRTPATRAYYGLLPESISHEGYAGHPVHSYWDDFFALRGLKDATALAAALGDASRERRFAAFRDDFRTTLLASLATTMAERGIDYLPGSVELADFDPSSTSIAVVPGGELERLPAAAVERTFQRYWEEIEERLAGTWGGQAYSPYELRNVGTFLRLGWRERAHALLAFLMRGRRPPQWNAWAEVVWLDPAAPRFIGDMPHTWVGAGFVQALRALFAYEREADESLVLAAGVVPSWLGGETGTGVHGLPTHFGTLDYTMRAEGPDAVRVRIGAGVVPPPGGLVVVSPLDRPLRDVVVDGRSVPLERADAVVIRTVPAEIELRY